MPLIKATTVKTFEGATAYLATITMTVNKPALLTGHNNRVSIYPAVDHDDPVAQSMFEVDVVVTSLVGSTLVGVVQTTNPRQIQPGDYVQAVGAGQSGTRSVENGTGFLYDATILGIQAAHDSTLFLGGAITVPAYSTIQSLGTRLNITKADTKIWWNFSHLKPVADAKPFHNGLIKIGGAPVAAGLSSLLTLNADHGDNDVTVASTAGFAPDDFVNITNNVGLPQLNRIREIRSATVMSLHRPVSLPVTTAAIGVVGKWVAFVSGIEMHDLFIDNALNTNPGLIDAFVAAATTTFTGDIAKFATGGTLTAAGSFASGDYIYITDGTKTGHGNALGWVTQIIAKVGAVITFNGGIPFAATAATTSVQNIGAAASTAQLGGNKGIDCRATTNTKFVNVTGTMITGSLIYTESNYEPEFHHCKPFHCGFPFNGVQSVATGGITCFYDTGTEWRNTRSEAGISWGLQVNNCYQPRGDLGSVNAFGRGVKFAGVWDAQMYLWALNNRASGVVVSEGSCFNMIDAKADGNGNEGLWVSDQNNTDNYIRFMGSNNVVIDASLGATDLRTIIELLNDDATAALSRGIIRNKAQSVTYSGALFTTSSAATFTLTNGAADMRYDVKQGGHRIHLTWQLLNVNVSAGVKELRMALPLGYTIQKTTSAKMSAINNGTEIFTAIAAAEAGLTYIKFYLSLADMIGGATGWALAAGTTTLQGSLEVEVA